MAGSVLVFLAILGGAVFAAAVWKRRVAETIPLSVVFLIAHTYLCGRIGLLKFSVIVTVFGMIALGGIGLYLSFRKTNPRRPAWDASFVWFALGFLWILYVSAGRMALEQSDYTQWALAPKEMFYANSLTPAGGAVATAPALAVFQTVFEVCQSLFAPGEGFQDWLLYAAYGTACLALLLPLVTSNHPRRLVRWGYSLLFLLALLCVPLQFFGLFSALNPDGLLAILAAAGFLAAAREKSPVQAVFTGLYLFALTLVKDAGILFALGTLAVYAVTLPRSENYHKSGRGGRAFMLAFPAAMLLLARLTWPHLSFTLREAGAAAEVSRLFWQKFAAKLIPVRAELSLHNGALFSLFTAHVSYLALAAAFAVFTVLLIRYLRSRRLLWDTGIALLYAAAAAALYIAGVWLAYLFFIDAADAAKLVNFERLAGVGFAFWVLLLAGAALRALAETPRWTWRRHMLVTLACVLIILSGSGALSGLTARDFTDQNDKYRAYYAVADEARDIIPANARVYIVSQNDDGTVYNTLRYALCPRGVNPEGTAWLQDPAQKPNTYAYPVTPAEWKAALGDYDYALVYRVDSYLQTAVAQAVAADAAIKANTVYRINKDSGMLEAAGE